MDNDRPLCSDENLSYIYFDDIVTLISFEYIFRNFQIDEKAVESYEDIVCADNIPISIDSPLEPLSLSAFIEESRIRLQDHAFLSYFRGHDPFKKSDVFSTFKGLDLAVKPVIFR